MFRLKFIISFVILMCLLTAFTVFTLQTDLMPMTMEDTDISLQRSASLVEKSHRIDEFALKEKARFISARPDLRRAVVADYEGDWRTERRNEVHKFLDRDGIVFDRKSRRNEGARNLDLDLMDRRPLDHDMFMALDETGRLISALGSGLTHMMGDNVGGQFSIVLDVMENQETVIDMWNWSWRAAEDRDLYIVAISPMLDPLSGESIGVIVLGHRVTDSVAKRRQSLIADGLGGDGSEQLSARAQVQTPQIAFFRGDRIYSSTLRSSQQRELRKALFETHKILDNEDPEKILDTVIDGQNHRNVVRFFPGQFETNNPAGVVILANVDEAAAPFHRAQSNILYITGGLLSIGLVLFWILFHVFLKPFGRIEDGVQEVISGDKDFVFDTDRDHEVANNLAHHLNLLSAFLQGKPMPDEEQSLGGWGGLDEDSEQTQKPSSIAGVPLGLGGGRKKKKKKETDAEAQAEEATADDADDSESDDSELSDKKGDKKPAKKATKGEEDEKAPTTEETS